MSWHDSEQWQRENTARLRLAANDWTQKAACRGSSTEVFYPERGESEQPAKQVCRRCVVKIECLTYALDAAEKVGVWGQSSERQRRILRQAIRIETEQGIDRHTKHRQTILQTKLSTGPRAKQPANGHRRCSPALTTQSENQAHQP